MITSLAILAVIFGAALMQSLVGFGSAMVAMALLPQWLGLRASAPLITLVGATLEIALPLLGLGI